MERRDAPSTSILSIGSKTPPPHPLFQTMWCTDVKDYLSDLISKLCGRSSWYWPPFGAFMLTGP